MRRDQRGISASSPFHKRERKDLILDKRIRTIELEKRLLPKEPESAGDLYLK